MNWQEISDSCPLAMKLLAEKWDLHYNKKRNDLEYGLDGVNFDDRDLYGFFDQNKIFIDIDHEFGEDWTFCIDQDGEGHNGNEMVYISRIDAETVAFTEAFKILEEKLKNNIIQK